MKTADISKREIRLDEAYILLLLEHSFEDDGTELSGRRAAHSHHVDTELVLTRS